MTAAAASSGSIARRWRRRGGALLVLMTGALALIRPAHAAPAWPEIHDKALSMVGLEYGFGRNDEQAVDCSALMQQVFAIAGIALPRTTRGLMHAGVPVPPSHMRAGDLLIYRWKPHQLHVALVLDRQHIEHASPDAGKVVVTPLTTLWRRRLVAVRRVLRP